MILTENIIDNCNKLGEYSKCKRNEVLMKKNNIIILTKSELTLYVKDSFIHKNSKNNIHLGQISKETINRIETKIRGIKKAEVQALFNNVKEYDLVITQDAIRHIKKPSYTINDVINIIKLTDEIVVEFDEV